MALKEEKVITYHAQCERCGHKWTALPLPTHCPKCKSPFLVRSCITFAGTRVDQMVAIEVLEALRPLGVQAALDALDHSQNQTDEKRRSLELALQKARYEASRIERQYQSTEPENRLVAAELEKRWNNALAQVAEMEQRLEEATIASPQLTPEQRERLLALGDDLEQ